jgi:hypothetical protein
MAHPLQFRKWFGALLVASKAENPTYILLNAIMPMQASLPLDPFSCYSSHKRSRLQQLTLAGTFLNWNAENFKLAPVLINFKRLTKEAC